MGKNEKISPAVIRRLPKYYRYLGELSKVGVNKISSRELRKIENGKSGEVAPRIYLFFNLILNDLGTFLNLP
jgi:NADH/NAD ratio-sensing transcriptional regulator Rex